MRINVGWMERYHGAQCFKPLRVEVKDSLQLVFCHHQAVVQAVQGGVNYVEAKSKEWKEQTSNSNSLVWVSPSCGSPNENLWCLWHAHAQNPSVKKKTSFTRTGEVGQNLSKYLRRKSGRIRLSIVRRRSSTGLLHVVHKDQVGAPLGELIMFSIVGKRKYTSGYHQLQIYFHYQYTLEAVH